MPITLLQIQNKHRHLAETHALVLAQAKVFKRKRDRANAGIEQVQAKVMDGRTESG